MSEITKEEAERFDRIVKEVVELERERRGIGTLGEKTVHAVIKRYMEPNEDYHEVPVDGYVADIYRDGHIIEIQTANFYKLRKKLDCFLEQYQVTVVYPIPHVKYLKWLDLETGELSERRKSPKKGNPYMAFKELYRIRQYLGHRNLRFCFLLMDIEEVRLLNGWSKDKKKGSERYERYPLQLIEQVSVEQIEDFYQMVPVHLPEVFSVTEFAKSAGVSKSIAGVAVLILRELGILSICGKKRNAYLYQVKE